jgi:hypothetical protein
LNYREAFQPIGRNSFRGHRSQAPERVFRNPTGITIATSVDFHVAVNGYCGKLGRRTSVKSLCSLDLLSRDDLESVIGREKIDYLNGLLLLLNQQADSLEGQTQVRGKPTDHATERWILTLADIFENGFLRPPSVSGSGEDPARRRGKFYRMLELGRPSRFPRHGRLSSKHVQILLKLRTKSMSLEEAARLLQERSRGAKTRLTRMKS